MNATVGVDFDEHRPGTYRGLMVYDWNPPVGLTERRRIATGDPAQDWAQLMGEVGGREAMYLSSFDNFAMDDPDGYFALTGETIAQRNERLDRLFQKLLP